MADVSDKPPPSPEQYKNLRHTQTTLSTSCRQLILHTYGTLRTENPSVSKNEICAQVAKLFGIGINTVYKCKREFKEKGFLESPGKKRPRLTKRGTRKVKYGDLTLTAIRKKVHDVVYKNELPTLLKIFNLVKEDDEIPNISKSTLSWILKDIGFVYQRGKRYFVLVEQDNIVVCRQQYLRCIGQYRKNANKIYYLGETWINEESDVIQKSQMSQRRLVICHVGSSSGFIQDGALMFESEQSIKDCRVEMTSERFEEWLKTILPKLEKNSLLVMDNSRHHRAKVEKIPTLTWRKQDVVDWLIKKGIYISEDLLKVELLQLVKEHKSKYDHYRIDFMAKLEGVNILRLPQFHCDLNPIEIAWTEIKHYVQNNNNNTTHKLDDIKKSVKEAIAQVTPEHLKSCEDFVINQESKLMKVDQISEDMVEKLIVQNNGVDIVLDELIESNGEDSDNSKDLSDNELLE